MHGNCIHGRAHARTQPWAQTLKAASATGPFLYAGQAERELWDKVGNRLYNLESVQWLLAVCCWGCLRSRAAHFRAPSCWMRRPASARRPGRR